MEYSMFIDPETEEPCPYDSSHMIRRKRMQYHLMKCRKNHPGKDFATCPFNACHEMPRPELRYHIATCPDKAVIEKDLAFEQEKEYGGGGMFKGCTDVPAYNSYKVTCSESWDDEVNPHPRIGVDETFLEKIKFKNITGMTPAEKRYFHRTLNPGHIPPAEPARSIPDKENQQPRGQGDGKLRLPKNAPKAFSMYQEEQPQQAPPTVFAYSLAQCGVGRGRGVGGNIGRGTGQPAAQVMPGRGISQPVAQGMPRPGQANPPVSSRSTSKATAPVTRVNPVAHQQPAQSHTSMYNQTSNLTGNHTYETRPSDRVPSGYNHNSNTIAYHPYEAIPPSYSTHIQTHGPHGVATSQTQCQVQAPPGVFPEQIQTRPVGRGRGFQLTLKDAWPSLNGGTTISNGDVFRHGGGRGLMLENNPSFVVPKVQKECPNLRTLSKDWFESEGSSSGSGTETQHDIHGIEGAKKRKQLQKKLRQIEKLEEKMQTGTPLNTEEEIKLSKKDELIEELQQLAI